jgi:hypothetical protein
MEVPVVRPAPPPAKMEVPVVRPAPPPAKMEVPVVRPAPSPQLWRDPGGPPRRPGQRRPRWPWARLGPGHPFWGWRHARWYRSFFWLHQPGAVGLRTVVTRSDSGLWASAANNLSLGLFWEYKKARILKTAKFSQDLDYIFASVDESLAKEASLNPNLNGLDLERLTLASFQRYVEANVESISVANGFYAMKVLNNRGKTNDWVATPVKDSDIPSIVQSLPPALMGGSSGFAASGQ